MLPGVSPPSFSEVLAVSRVSARLSDCVYHGSRQSRRRALQAVKNAVRETAQHDAANIFSNDRKALWIFSDRLHHLLDRFHEF